MLFCWSSCCCCSQLFGNVCLATVVGVFVGTVVVFVVGSISSPFSYSFLSIITIPYYTSSSLLLYTIHLLYSPHYFSIYSCFFHAISVPYFIYNLVLCVFSYLLFILDYIFFHSNWVVFHPQLKSNRLILILFMLLL